MSRLRYWLAGALTAICLAVAANAQVVTQVVNTVAVGGITGLGTSVATALGINVGTAGAVLVKGTSVCADLSNATGACSATFVSPTAWTPADGSGASLTFTGVSANYTRNGNMVFAYAQLTYPATGNASAAVVSGLPVNTGNANYAKQCTLNWADNSTPIHMIAAANAATVALYTSAGVAVTNAQVSASTLIFICIYPAS